MSAASLYDRPEWRATARRARRRDADRCTVARLLGGACAGILHVHHIEPVGERPDLALDLDNVATVCASHHPVWESLRRSLVRARRRDVRRCTHRHVYPGARAECERRLARRTIAA